MCYTESAGLSLSMSNRRERDFFSSLHVSEID